MKINLEKGLFRIYVVWAIIVIIVVLIQFINMPQWYNRPDDFFHIPLLIATPWIIHYVVKWIIKGLRS